MKNDACSTCPGCKKHCPSCKPCCGYGRKYFAQCCRKNDKSSKDAWKKKLEKDGLVLSFLTTGRAIKKAIKKNRKTEAEILSMLTPTDSAVLGEILKKLSAHLNCEK